MARRYDADWDAQEELKALERKERPGVLTTTRILVALLVVIVAAILVARLVLWEEPEFAEVSPRLIGLWTTSHPEYNDRYVEFRKNFVIFGTGGTGEVKFKVLGMDAEKVGDIDHYTIHYRDLAGTKHRVRMFLDEAGEALRFTDSADARWIRWER
jgi:hypothetical protein